MFKNFEDFSKFGKDNAELVSKAFAAQQKSAQAIAAEVQAYSKGQFEAGSQYVEKLLGVKTLDKAVELQSDFAKTAYDSFVSYATKVGELVSGAAKEAAKPFEVAASKVAGK